MKIKIAKHICKPNQKKDCKMTMIRKLNNDNGLRITTTINL